MNNDQMNVSSVLNLLLIFMHGSLSLLCTIISQEFKKGHVSSDQDYFLYLIYLIVLAYAPKWCNILLSRKSSETGDTLKCTAQ